MLIVGYSYSSASRESRYSSYSKEYSDTTLLDEVVVIGVREQIVEKSGAGQVSKVFLEKIEKEGKNEVKDLSGIVPNLYIPDYGAKMTSSIYIRGLGARIDNPVMGIYIDGVGVANKNAFDFDLDEIGKVEVFRGPQGTLYGKNTIGGLISVESMNPWIFEGTRIMVGYGNANTLRTRIAHYKKWKDTGLSAAVMGRHSDGFFVNQYDGKKCDFIDQIAARLRVDYKTDSIRITNTTNYSYVKQGGFPYHLPGNGVNHNDYCGYYRHSLVEGLNYQVNFGKYDFSGSTSYQLLKDQMDMDQDFLPLSYFNMSQKQLENYVGQELLFKPEKPMGFWNWVTGASLSYKNNKLSAPVHFQKDGIDELILKNANSGIQSTFPEGEIMFQEDHFTIADEFTIQNAGIALFHTSFFKTGNWQFELGVRFDYEHNRIDYQSDALIHYLFTETMSDYKALKSTLSGTERLDYFEVLPKVSVSYNGDGWSTYATLSEGYKGGGFNTQLFSDILKNKMMTDLMGDLGVYFSDAAEYEVKDVINYKPERCLNAEIGAKIGKTIDDWRLDGGLSLFLIEIFNQQLTVFPEKGTGRYMTNAGESRSMGFEASLAARFNGLDLTASYGLTDARFVKYNDGKADFAGKRVPFVPYSTLNVGVGYRINLGHTFFRYLYLNANTNAYGDIYWDEENSVRQPFYALLNANVSLETKYFDFELWGKNLTGTEYDVFYFVSCGNGFLQSGKPRTYGAKITFNI